RGNRSRIFRHRCLECAGPFVELLETLASLDRSHPSSSNQQTRKPAMETATKPAEEMCQMPKPTKEHDWLQKFVGEWESEVEIVMDPSQPPMLGKGTESTRMI